MSKRLMPTYLVNFLKEIYDGTIPSNFGKRMVSRQFIARVKELYETLGGDNPSDYSRRMVNEYLIKFFNEIEIVEYTDDDVLMTKTIPSDLVYPACRIDAIGGMSYKSENLIPKSKLISSTTFQGITITNNNDGSLTLNGTYTGSEGAETNIATNLNIPSGTYSFAIFNTNTTTTNNNIIRFNTNDTSHNLVYLNNQNASVTKTTTETIRSLFIRFSANSIFNNVRIYPMLIEGSTAPTEFKVGFEGIRDSAVTSVKSYDSNNNLIDTFTVPSAITSLEGYGQSNPDDPTKLNVVDFINGKYYEKGYINNGVWVSKEAEISITEQAPLLEVVDGGTIVFENEYGQDMPNEVTTWIKES